MIEREPGRYDFGLHDRFVANAARAGLGVLPILIDPPPFRSSRPATGARRGVYPPASNAEFAAFAQLLVRRYGPDGGFWRANPGLPQMPIRSWEVWNEPNLPQYWAAGPDPAAYAVGFAVATGLIHVAGIGIGLTIGKLFDGRLARGLGGAIAAAGVYFLIA